MRGCRKVTGMKKRYFLHACVERIISAEADSVNAISKLAKGEETVTTSFKKTKIIVDTP